MNGIIAYKSKTVIAVLLLTLFLCSNARATSNNFSDYTPEKDNIRILKFDDVVKRYNNDISTIPKVKEKLEEISSESKFEQMVEVNDLVNKAVTYKEDIDNYKVSDYWATPKEFFKNGGDCEDYALTKYFILKELKFPTKDLKINIAEDKYLRMLHSLLLVTIEGEEYILDNQNDKVISTKNDIRYIPVYSVNELSFFRFTKGLK